jgi:cytochrome c-type biogenesis protein CcmH/NrfF
MDPILWIFVAAVVLLVVWIMVMYRRRNSPRGLVDGERRQPTQAESDAHHGDIARAKWF